MSRKTYWSAWVLIAAMWIAGCSGGSGKKSEAIAATSGTPQSATVNTAFGAPLVATVMNGTSPVSGVVVTFAAPASGASGTFAGGANTATTNASGVATSAAFSANATAGAYMVTASASGATGTATYSLTNTAGAAATIIATSGSSQSATVSTAFAAPLVATVEDSGSNPVSGVVVTFTAPASGASGTFAGGANTATTNSSGVATSAVFTANATVGGPYIVTAKAAGVAATVTYNLTNTAPAPEAIAATSGTPQSAAISTAFAAPLVATVTKAGAGVSGAVVTFTAPATGASGTFAGGVNTATTNASGVATSAIFTANATVGGPYIVTAAVSGVATPANFSLTNTASAPETIAATSGTPQSATVSKAFAAPLVATVSKSGAGVSGVVVTFTAPATGASGTFAGGVNTATTNASGVATSAVFTANATAGGPYNVTATATGIATPANFSLTNTAAATSSSFSFSLSGMEEINDGPNFYALAGAVQIDPTGKVLGGEQDYNDAFGLTSPSGGDKITGGTLTVSGTTGQGTLTLTTNNTSIGKSGTETLGVQFVNANHAMVEQFDGTATSSGSMDLQTLSGSLAKNFAFTMSGVDPDYNPIGVGGVFAVTSPSVSGKFDANDDGTVTTGTAFSGTISAVDSYGRGTITGASFAVKLTYYMVGPEVMRIVDMDADDSAGGTAYGQGTGTFSNAALSGISVLSLAGNSFSNNYGAVAIITASNTGSSPSDFSGGGDDNELANSVQAFNATISGTYSVQSNGYGSLTIKAGSLGDISALGLYVTDPKLNLLDPNNTTSGTGGGLLLDLADSLASGVGLVTPQTDPSSASFTGSYAFGAQAYNTFNSGCQLCEFDFVAQGKMTSGTLNGTALISDPFNTLTGSQTDSGATFTGTPRPDSNGAGRYTMSKGNTPSNPLVLTIGAASGPFDLVIDQANGGQLFWLGADENGVWLGTLQQQGSLTGLAAAATANAK
jgi:hypothetical protein